VTKAIQNPLVNGFCAQKDSQPVVFMPSALIGAGCDFPHPNTDHFLYSMLGLYKFSIGIEWKLNLLSLDLEGFGLQNQQSLDGKRFYMDAGEADRGATAAQFWMQSAR